MSTNHPFHGKTIVMERRNVILAALLVLGLLSQASGSLGGEIRLLQREPDPHGTPRPAPNAHDVPLATSIYFELGAPPDDKHDQVLAESVAIRLEPKMGEPIDVLQPGRRFAKGGSGWLRPKQVGGEAEAAAGSGDLAVYAELGQSLKPATTYRVRVQARSRDGAALPAAAGAWTFTTEAAAGVHTLNLPLDLGTPPVHWHGAFFSGVCHAFFCTRAATYGPTYDLMNEARKQHPQAWSYQRDFWMTGSEDQKPGYFGSHLPNIVRERQTRRIVAMDSRQDGVLLRVEEFFGHQQYGDCGAGCQPASLPADRQSALLSTDYHPGDEVLIADGSHDARSKVIAIDDKAGTVLVGPIAAPAGGWKIAYEGPLPEREDPDAPGLFPPGGCYLRKFNPPGTACYYWGRLDKEWDLVHRHCGRRLVVNFADAPGDLALDGRSWTTVKDYAQWHQAARTIAGHIIDRYGRDALDFTWSIFNEPDLGPAFWRTDWNELQRYYDYTTDAILRAFEDRGYDSDRVFIGGLELAGAFGLNLRLTDFLAHCSPRATAQGALPLNAALADPHLAGKHSRRVETLCGKHSGKGSPCNFVSVHSYNRSEMMAAKLLLAKQTALAIDADYYRDLWVNSHESCPDWCPPPDEAAADSYLGNGYFSTWCVDVIARQLQQAAKDPRYAFGETLLTVWPPLTDFTGLDAVTRILSCDGQGSGRNDRQTTIPVPIFHVLGLLADMGNRYWVLPQRQRGGHTVGGFASRDEQGIVRIVLCAHHAQDTQSRSDAAFDVALEIDHLGWEGGARVEEYRFDRDHNSYFREGRALRQRAAQATPDGQHAHGQAYSPDDVERIRRLAECHATASALLPRPADGRLRLTARVAGNGLNMILIRPGPPKGQ